MPVFWSGWGGTVVENLPRVEHDYSLEDFIDKPAAIDYCPHCGICLFEHCSACQERKSAFARFCHACGAAGQKIVG
ncbi:MAG: hypothetical protein H6R15_1845 [Proteobacteria bacterium]|nr:hypothetical protein [Pseudomonadota bacterium]